MSWKLEHLATVISGCESINQHMATGCGLNADGEYAFTVLKLHAQDAGFYAGQEGFLDTVKKGAKTAKEFILEFFKALREFFKNKFKAIGDKLTKLKGGDKEKAASTAKTSLAQLSGAINILKMVTERDDDLETGYYREILDFMNKVIAADQLAQKATSGDVDRLITLVQDSLRLGQRLSDRMASDWERNVEKADSDPDKKKRYMVIGKAGVDVGRAVGLVSSAANVWGRELRDAGVKE